CLSGLRWLSEKLTGFSSKRDLPRWRTDWFDDQEARGANASGRAVVLFVDTFTRYFEPDNARAAVNVLTRAGYNVIVPSPRDRGRPLCCGRTFLTEGLVDEARAEARRMIDAFKPYVARGVPVIGLEPSCLFSLKDEFQGLKLGVDADTLAANAFLF